MIKNSIEGRLSSSKYCDYIKFLLDEKNKRNRAMITAKRVQQFCARAKVKKDLKEMVIQSHNNKLKVSEREFNFFFKHPCKPKDLNVIDEKFLLNLGNRIGKMKNHANHPSSRSATISNEMNFIDDLHYVIDHEDESNNHLSEEYLKDFLELKMGNKVSNDNSFKLIADEKPIIDYSVQRYKYFFKNFDTMSDDKRFELFLSLFNSNWELKNNSKGDTEIEFVPIMKEVNTGLNIALRIDYNGNNVNRKSYVITPSISMNTQDATIILKDDPSVEISFKVAIVATNYPNTFYDYSEIEDYIESSVRRYSLENCEDFDEYITNFKPQLSKYIDSYVFTNGLGVINIAKAFSKFRDDKNKGDIR